MIKKYVLEKRSWISLIVSLQLFTIFVAYFDSALSVQSILYVVFLSMIVFIIFLVSRYKKETTFYKSLADWESTLDVTNIAPPTSPFEKIIERQLINQTRLLKRTSSQNQIALEEEKDDLLAWIHEVKTPLTAIHLMLDRIDDQVLKAHLTYEWLRIHHLLDQQLHQRRIPNIEHDLYIEMVDLESIIFQEIKTLQSWCIQKGIGFDVKLEVTEVLTDAKWIAFIIRQLLTNAVKYSKISDIVIQSYRLEDQIILSIQDFGRGIHNKDIGRIFDKGFTSTTSREDSAATGMGLYLAKKAADSLHIVIHVQSEPMAGSRFSLYFPQKNEFVRIISM